VRPSPRNGNEPTNLGGWTFASYTMNVRDIPAHVERTHDYPVAHDRLRTDLGSLRIEAPDGGSQPLATLLDACDECGFEATYESPDALRTTLLCCVDEAHVGRSGYDDRGANPGRSASEQVSF
jgi:hypothetical protein